jgi:hypothetical protein
MIFQHPLNDYFKLIDANAFEEKFYQFNNPSEFIENFKLTYDQHDITCPEIVWNKITCSYQIIFDKTYAEITFYQQVTESLSKFYLQFENVVRQLTIPPISKNNKAGLVKLQHGIVELLDKIKTKRNEIQEPIKDHLKKMDDYIVKSSNRKVAPIKSLKPIPKIEWLGNINTLTNFFIELLDDSNSLKKPLIQCELKDLKEFIISNFSYEGDIISEATLEGYFGKNRRLEKYPNEKLDINGAKG